MLKTLIKLYKTLNILETKKQHLMDAVFLTLQVIILYIFNADKDLAAAPNFARSADGIGIIPFSER